MAYGEPRQWSGHYGNTFMAFQRFEGMDVGEMRKALCIEKGCTFEYGHDGPWCSMVPKDETYEEYASEGEHDVECVREYGHIGPHINSIMDFAGMHDTGDKEDTVNHPAHYTDGKIEVSDFIVDKGLNFCCGNVVKYVARAGKKDPAKHVEDLEKGLWYLKREIQRLKEQKDNG
jgi:hypothetical protein